LSWVFRSGTAAENPGKQSFAYTGISKKSPVLQPKIFKKIASRAEDFPKRMTRLVKVFKKIDAVV